MSKIYCIYININYVEIIIDIANNYNIDNHVILMMINYDTMISFDDSFDDSCITSQESSSTVSSPYNNNLGKLFTNNNDISSSTSSSTTTTPTKSFIYTRSEEISIDENRFALTRQWNVTLPHLLYIMLNPSSAT